MDIVFNGLSIYLRMISMISSSQSLYQLWPQTLDGEKVARLNGANESVGRVASQKRRV